MDKFRAFLTRKNIVFSGRRYGIDALGAMAQGLFCSLLIGTIIKTLGAQLGVKMLVDIGAYAMAVSGPAMAVAIGYALQAPPMVLFSLAAVGWASNAEGGAGGPLAVLVIAIVAAECGKAVSKETKVDLLVTPAVTILVGVALAKLIAPPIGTAASAFGLMIDRATKLQPFWMGMAVSVLVGIALTLPISSAAPALLDGHGRVRAGGHRAHAADLLGGHLLGLAADRPCGRRGGRRLLRADGGLCGDEL